MKHRSNSSWLRANKRLQDAVRICDSRDRYDTLTLTQELMLNPANMLALFDTVSLNWFLCQPASVDTAANAWAQTHWLTAMEVFSLGAFVVSKLELALWRAFRCSVDGSLARGVSLPIGACCFLCGCASVRLCVCVVSDAAA